MLKAFKTYYETAELEATTDPHHVYDLRAKLDAAGYYDDFEVDRVARVELDPKGTQAQLQAAKDTLDALVLFKNDMGAFVRLYAFLSQIFDYGNTDIEKRFLFYKRLIPLLEFGRERDAVDLTKVTLTHHSLRHTGRQPLNLGHGETPKLPPMDAVGSGAV